MHPPDPVHVKLSQKNARLRLKIINNTKDAPTRPNSSHMIEKSYHSGLPAQIPISEYCFQILFQTILPNQLHTDLAMSDNPFHNFPDAAISADVPTITFHCKKYSHKCTAKKYHPCKLTIFWACNNTNTTAIPRIMIAVLRLLAPTSPTTGRTLTTILQTVVNFPMLFTFRIITYVKNNIIATFANSDG